MANKRVLFFSHIPRTAGTTLRAIINRQYPRDVIHTFRGGTKGIELFRMLPEHSRTRFKVLQGHNPFGLHRYLHMSVDYITMLREPVDRVTSFYYWIQRSQGNHLYEKVANMSLEDFADSGLPQVVNQQTEFVSGLINNSSALEVAKRNLDFHFIAFGIAEHFDESLLLFKKLLGWRNIRYVNKSVVKTRPPKREIPIATKRLIEKHNYFDMELYEFAKKRFEEVIKKIGQSFENDVRMFRPMNKTYDNFTESGN